MNREQLSQNFWAVAGRQFWRRRINRSSLVVIGFLFFIGLFSDFLASDRPILLMLEGELYVFPNLTDPADLRRYNNQILLEDMTVEDWAVFPPVPYGYNAHDLTAVLSEPSQDHMLGTDSEGRDVLSRLLHGTRVSLSVGVLAVSVLLLIGVTLGAIAGYFGGLFDAVLTRVLEIVHALPTILLLITLLSVLMPSGYGAVFAMMFVIGLVGWTDVARLVRGEILRIKTLEYVQAARALGFSHKRIILRHVLPNALSPVLVSATFAMAAAILIESALSFLGFGIPPDMASWGALLDDGRQHTDAWWLAVFPGAAIFVTVTVYNLAGEGLRDAIDPRLKQ